MIQYESGNGSVSALCPLGCWKNQCTRPWRLKHTALCHVSVFLSPSNSDDCFMLSRMQPWLTTLSPLHGLGMQESRRLVALIEMF